MNRVFLHALVGKWIMNRCYCLIDVGLHMPSKINEDMPPLPGKHVPTGEMALLYYLERFKTNAGLPREEILASGS